jgi:hypothetical protein
MSMCNRYMFCCYPQQCYKQCDDPSAAGTAGTQEVSVNQKPGGVLRQMKV